MKDHTPLRLFYSDPNYLLRYILFIGLIWLAHELFKDFCFERLKKMTDQDYIVIALNDLFKSGNVKTHGWDDTAEAYLQHHPGCCRVWKEYGLFSPLTTEIIAEIIYERTEKAKEVVNGKVYSHFESLSYMTDCGRIYRHSGEEITTPQWGFNQKKI